MIQEDVQKVLRQARDDATMEKFNLDGSPARDRHGGAPGRAVAVKRLSRGSGAFTRQEAWA